MRKSLVRLTLADQHLLRRHFRFLRWVPAALVSQLLELILCPLQLLVAADEHIVVEDMEVSLVGRPLGRLLDCQVNPNQSLNERIGHG